MKPKDLRAQSSKELQEILHKKQADILNLRFRVSGGRVKNVNELRDTRKDIARIRTLLQEKN